MTDNIPRVLSKKQLLSIIPYTPQHISRLEQKNQFPRRIRLGAGRVGWLEEEVRIWIAARVAERDCTPKKHT